MARSERDDAAQLAHYGARYLIVREDDQGFVTVTRYAENADWQTAYDTLERAYNQWAEAGEDD